MSNTIYIITNTINNKVYIGQTINFKQRKYQHFNKFKKLNTHLYRAMRKYGVDNFIISPICSVLTRKFLNDLEIQFIKEYDSFHNGYNMTTGASHVEYCDYTLKKMSISASNAIRPRCPEHMKIKFSKERIGINNPMFKGYYHTPFGILKTTNQIKEYTTYISKSTIFRWCKKYPDKPISKNAILKSRYLTEDMIGKTYREIGFWFEAI